MDDDGNILIQTLSDGQDGGCITLYSDGSAKAIISNDGETQQYNLEINELSENVIDIDVYDQETDEKVKEYNDISELKYDEYEGQVATEGALVYSLSLLLEILMYVSLCVIIAGVTYYSIARLIEKIQSIAKTRTENKLPPIFYNAHLLGPQVFIDFYNPFYEDMAVLKLSAGFNTYTFFQAPASYVCQKVPGADLALCIKPELDKDLKAGFIYFRHFHYNRNNHVHSFYGKPITA